MSVEASIPIDKTASSSTITIPANTRESNTTSTADDLDQRSDLQCPDCRSRNVFEEYLSGEIICRDCGHVFEGFIFEVPDPELSHSQSFTKGLTRVSRTGRRIGDLSHKHARSSLPNQAFENSRAYRAKRFEQIREYLIAAGRQSGLSANHAARAYFLWKKAMDFLKLRFWEPAARIAIASLYLAAKESKKGISLVDLAVQTKMSPFKIGANYKLVKSCLTELNVIAVEMEEDDPWIMLQRIMSIGSPDSIPQEYIESLPKKIQDVLGVGMEPGKSVPTLRNILSSAQKCMAIAKDSGLVTGRQPQALAATCLVTAIEIHLALTSCPDVLFEFTSKLFGASVRTVIARHREMRRTMLTWARRLPFVKGAVKIKESKLVYYMDDVIKYFGHLEEQNRQLWAMLDKNEGSVDGEAGSDEDNGDRLGPGGHITEEDLDAERHMLQDGSFWTADDDGNIYDDWGGEYGAEGVNQDCKTVQLTESSDRMYPPAYSLKLEREKRQLRYIQEAKSLLNERNSLMPGNQKAPDKKAYSNKKVEELARQKVVWISQLLDHGTRTEKEILEATDNLLEYWVRSDLTKKSAPRSQTQLDSAQLTAEDLDEQEMKRYLRNPSDAEVVLRVMGQTYTEAERSASRMAKLRGPKVPKNTGKLKRKIKESTSDSQPQPKKKVRSSKLNLEALRELEAEEGGRIDEQGIIIQDARDTADANGHEEYNDSDDEYDSEVNDTYSGYEVEENYDEYNEDTYD
ncbi:hypothetical protein BGX27_009517 [Mortierella sp. AM989]|nr:hypothetical protein BGX27_009517 [Mortierella sp. AM989]